MCWKAKTLLCWQRLVYQGYSLSSGHMRLWELDRKEDNTREFMPSNCGLEKTPESPLDSKEIKPVNLKGNQPWILIGRTDARAEATVFDHLMQRADSLEKTDAGKDWRQEGKGTTEDKMVGWHHQFSGHEFEQTGRQWRTGKPGVLLSVGWQRVGHNWATEQQVIATVIMTQYLPAVFF